MSEDKNNIIKEDLLGSSEWKKSKLGYLTGYSAAKKIGASVVNAPVSYANSYLKAVVSVFKRKRQKTHLSDIDDSRVRFQAAMRHYNRSEADLVRLEKQTKSTFLMYGLFSLLSIIWGLYQMASPNFEYSIFSVLFCIFPFFILFPLFIKHYYWLMQIRERDLFPFSDFISRFHHLGKISLYFLGMVILSIPTTALAAFSPVDTLPETDLFLRMVQMIAPVGAAGVGVDGLSPWAAPLGNAFYAFNTSLMTVGTMMLGWQTIAGTVASAYEGEVLGQRWHTIWAPARVVAGVGSLAPIASGYCFAQLLVLQIMIWGGGIANEVWGSYVGYYQNNSSQIFEYNPTWEDTEARGNSGITALSANADARAFLLSTLEKQVCLSGFRKMFEHYINEYNRNASTPLDLDTELALGVNSEAFRSQNGFTGIWGIFGHTASGASFDRTALASSIPAFSSASASDLSTYAAAFQAYSGDLVPPVPGAVWDFGDACGKIRLNYYVVSALADQRAAAFENPNSVLSASQLYSLTETVVNLNNQAAERINSQVLPNIRQAADMIVDSYGTFDPVSRTTLPELLQPRGPAEVALGNAFMDYQAIWREIDKLAEGAIFNTYSGVDKDMIFSSISEKGWAASGSFYVLLARIQQQAHSLNSVLPTVEPLNYNPFINSISSFIFGDSDALAFFEGSDSSNNSMGQVGLLPGLAMFISTAIVDPNQSIEAQLFNEIDDPGAITQFLRYISGDFYDFFFVDMVSVDPFNAMLHLMQTGSDLITWLGKIFMFFVVGSTIAGAAGGFVGFLQRFDFTGTTSVLTGAAGGFLGAFEGLVFIIKAILFMIFGIAIVHLYVLPMFPYVIMTFFVMGMLVLVAEALIAAPIWAFFHVRLDGAEFVDQVQKPGYMIAFNLLLRPTLAIFGLIMSYAIFGAIVWFTNQTFSLAGKSVLIDSSSIVGVLVMGAIITYIHYQVAIRSFTLITQIPDRVTRWFGQGGENLGEQSDAEKSTSMIVGGVVSRTEGLARSAGLASSLGGGRAAAGAGSANKGGKGGDAGGEGSKGGSGGSVGGSNT